MRRWEYKMCTVSCDEKTVNTFANDMGKQGWDLVSASARAMQTEHLAGFSQGRVYWVDLFFKREMGGK